MFYRITDKKAIAFDDRSMLVAVEQRADVIVLTFRQERGALMGPEAVVVKQDEEQYEKWRAFIADCPLLIDEVRVQQLRQIQRQNASPYYEEELHTLTMLFQSLRGVEELELRIRKDGSGAIWLWAENAPPPYPILEWRSLAEGIRLLEKAVKEED